MKYMSFQIIFNILKIKEFCRLIHQMYFRPQLPNQVLQTESFWQNNEDNYGASFNTQKGTHLLTKFFQLIHFRTFLGKLD